MGPSGNMENPGLASEHKPLFVILATMFLLFAVFLFAVMMLCSMRVRRKYEGGGAGGTGGAGGGIEAGGKRPVGMRASDAESTRAPVRDEDGGGSRGICSSGGGISGGGGGGSGGGGGG